MKTVATLVSGIATLCLLGACAQTAPVASASPMAANPPMQPTPVAYAAGAAAGCGPIGAFQFICGVNNPEDLMAVPGSDRWLIASGLRRGEVKGHLHLIDTQTKTAKVFDAVTPAAVTASQHACPALPNPAMFYAHGLALRKADDGRHTLYVINHEELERIELYTLDARGAKPTLTWRDCIVFDVPKTRPNSLAILPNGALVISSFGNPGVKIDEKGGAIFEWSPERGIVKLEGTDMVGPNGIEASPDGRYIYVNGWGEQEFVRITRGTSPLRIEEFPVDFQPDNLHWAPDGMLLSAGTNGSERFGYCSELGCEGFVVAKVDPQTMQHRVIMRYVGDAAPLAHASVAYQVGDHYWLGTLDGDRVAYVPMAAVASPAEAAAAAHQH